MNVVLISSDNKSFTVSKEVIRFSSMISDQVEDVDGAESRVPLPRVSGLILKMVVAFLNHHADDNDQEEGYDGYDEWDKEFVKDETFALVSAANYLGIPILMHAACECVAEMLKGKTTPQMRVIMKMKSDYTKEEEEEVRKANTWKS